MLSFDLMSGYEAGQTFIKSSDIISYARSPGGVSSTIAQPAVLFGGWLPAEVVERQGIPSACFVLPLASRTPPTC